MRLTKRIALAAGLAAITTGLVALPASAAESTTSSHIQQSVRHAKGGKVTVTNNSTATVTLRVTMVDSNDWYDGHGPDEQAPQGFQGARLAPGQSTSAQLGVWVETSSAPFRIDFLTNPKDSASAVASAEVMDKRTKLYIHGWGLDRTTQRFDAAQADQTKQGKVLIGKRYQLRVQCGLGSGDETLFTLTSQTP